jgi:hypothetical protein
VKALYTSVASENVVAAEFLWELVDLRELGNTVSFSRVSRSFLHRPSCLKLYHTWLMFIYIQSRLVCFFCSKHHRTALYIQKLRNRPNNNKQQLDFCEKACRCKTCLSHLILVDLLKKKRFLRYDNSSSSSQMLLQFRFAYYIGYTDIRK